LTSSCSSTAAFGHHQRNIAPLERSADRSSAAGFPRAAAAGAAPMHHVAPIAIAKTHAVDLAAMFSSDP
jgi:hypothetical protein